MLDVIRTVRPRWVVGENVYGIVNWSEGLVFEQVCADLEAAGYEVQPYIIPACGVGAPHRRDRCWFVAHRADAGSETMRERSNGVHADSIASDTPCLGRITRRSKSNRTTQNSDAKRRIPDWNGFPTQPPVCGGDDGFPGELVGIAFPRWRREAVKACGNAIVPQVALRIFETINEYEKI